MSMIHQLTYRFRNVYDTHEYYTYLKRQRPGWTCELAKVCLTPIESSRADEQEDYGVIYKSLEDKTSSNLYIQGFTAEDNMDVSLSPLSVAHTQLMISTSKASCTPARSYPTVDLETIATTSEESSWLGTSHLTTGLKLMSRVQSRPQADEVIERVCPPFCRVLMSSSTVDGFIR